MKKLLLSLIVAFCASVGISRAQYYDLGQSPASIKWDRIKNKHNKVIYPQGGERAAAEVVNYLDTLRPYVWHGYKHGPLRMPIVLHSQNFASNGIVLWAPKRMEWITVPSIQTYAMPWLKQLAIHESRHAVQYNNLNRGTIRGLSYIIGQQGSFVGAALMPLWAIEGDAVLTETQFSSFGRALQPSFTMEYRAYHGEGGTNFRIDKWFCGSYKDMIPDHYQLGYQLTAYADTRYGHNIWNKVASYGAKYPFFIFTSSIALKRYYNTSVDKLFYGASSDLKRHWSSLPEARNSSTIIPTPTTSYTSYSSPLVLSDTTLVAVKSDYDRYNRLVEVNTRTGEEKTLSYIGQVNTQLSVGNGKLYWTEYQHSALWDQRVNSQICTFDLKTGKRGKIKGERKALYAVAMPGDGYAHVEYDYGGTYTIKAGELSRTMPDSIEIHGFTRASNGNFYFIGLSDSGMWIGELDRALQNMRMVTRPSYVTVGNLRAGEGNTLVFNSIMSGKDEIHVYNLDENREIQLTSSKYGSFAGALSSDGKSAVMTTYGREGYLLAKQQVREDEAKEVAYSRIPRNAVNPYRRQWNLINMDTVKVSPQTELPVKRYRKGLNMFNFHSWAPVSFDPNELINEYHLEVYAGVTLISQNLLSSTYLSLDYAYMENGKNRYKAALKYYGLPVKFEVETTFGGGKQAVSYVSGLEVPRRKDYFEITTRAYLPIQLSGGYNLRYLTPQVELYHYNDLLPNECRTAYVRGLQKARVLVQYSEQIRMAYRDFLPRWGYTLRASAVFQPFRYDSYGTIWSAYGRVYMPGVAKHHSLSLRAVGQYQQEATLNFKHKELFPIGAQYNFASHKYLSGAVDYQLPVCYPDGGISSLLYVKRIRANMYFGYARYRKIAQSRWDDVYSYGGDIYFDINPLRMPAAANTTILLSIHKPSDRNGVVLGVGLILPI